MNTEAQRYSVACSRHHAEVSPRVGSLVQMRCSHSTTEAGLKEEMLVFSPNEIIFHEYRADSPAGLRQKATVIYLIRMAFWMRGSPGMGRGQKAAAQQS